MSSGANGGGSGDGASEVMEELGRKVESVVIGASKSEICKALVDCKMDTNDAALSLVHTREASNQEPSPPRGDPLSTDLGGETLGAVDGASSSVPQRPGVQSRVGKKGKKSRMTLLYREGSATFGIHSSNPSPVSERPIQQSLNAEFNFNEWPQVGQWDAVTRSSTLDVSAAPDAESIEGSDVQVSVECVGDITESTCDFSTRDVTNDAGEGETSHCDNKTVKDKSSHEPPEVPDTESNSNQPGLCIDDVQVSEEGVGRGDCGADLIESTRDSSTRDVTNNAGETSHCDDDDVTNNAGEAIADRALGDQPCSPLSVVPMSIGFLESDTDVESLNDYDPGLVESSMSEVARSGAPFQQRQQNQSYLYDQSYAGVRLHRSMSDMDQFQGGASSSRSPMSDVNVFHPFTSTPGNHGSCQRNLLSIPPAPIQDSGSILSFGAGSRAMPPVPAQNQQHPVYWQDERTVQRPAAAPGYPDYYGPQEYQQQQYGIGQSSQHQRHAAPPGYAGFYHQQQPGFVPCPPPHQQHAAPPGPSGFFQYPQDSAIQEYQRERIDDWTAEQLQNMSPEQLQQLLRHMSPEELQQLLPCSPPPQQHAAPLGPRGFCQNPQDRAIQEYQRERIDDWTAEQLQNMSPEELQQLLRHMSPEELQQLL